MKRIKQFIEGWKSEVYNTNNAWGFGGVIGIRYIGKHGTLLIGHACYRHAPSTRYLRAENTKTGKSFSTCDVTKDTVDTIIAILSEWHVTSNVRRTEK